MANILRIDHFVIPCSDVHATADFFARVVGVAKVEYGAGRVALRFGDQKINLQPAGWNNVRRAHNHLPGTQDFCFVTDTPVEDVVASLRKEGVAIVDGPVTREGALGAMTSVYFRDPDRNLVEIANYG